MEIKVSKEYLATKKLFLATPMYGGACTGTYAKSLADLSAMCLYWGLPLQIHMLFNESLITRARNYACDEFMRSGASHMLFIDSDIGFNPQDILVMMSLATDESEFDIIGAAYPKKCISWEKIKMAVDKGFADKDPNMLDKFVGDYVFNPKGGTKQIQIGEPCEVLEIGTGYMLIRRKTMETFRDAFPQYLYRPDHVRTEHFDGSRQITMYFQAEIDAKSNRYLSEDYWFCQKMQELGMKTWLCPWMETNHTGTMVYGGSLAALAAIGASPTADLGELKKNRLAGQQQAPVELPAP